MEKTPATTFDTTRDGTGTREWAEHTVNIAIGCSHDCRYCYAAANAARLKLRPRAEWAREEFSRKAGMKSFVKKDGVVMFPTTHDITPFNLEECIRVARLILEAGNQLLVVSKPHLDCVVRLCDDLAAHRDAILFRFTIGTLDPDISSHWEPGAPSPNERLAALVHARVAGFRTSVSVEPLLGGVDTALAILFAVRPYVTDTVWIGKMNKIALRVAMDTPAARAEAEAIESAQADEEIMRLVAAVGEDPLVRWKDSIQKVIRKAGFSLRLGA